MTEARTTAKGSAKRLWVRSLDRARKNAATGAALPWHVRCAEEYLKAFLGKKVRLLLATLCH
jgi:hypothetical protein